MLTKTGVLKREQLGIKSLSFKPNLVVSVPTKSIYFGIFFGKWVKIKNRYFGQTTAQMHQYSEDIENRKVPENKGYRGNIVS